ncbi:MDR family MFS transporter [Aurantibacter aestuarii]|uniref:MFS transporter n=1 Tax=Aurantibacter aestuarii TaxID=1266046 RepID=A0A2T1NA23_9FLAO|nr:MFS transporter [Aurantibacter aestuarii]PSG88709.1 MFS transporter [Aurantibacter aestuarii]
MKSITTTYINTFKGLSKEVWWLALVTFINRAGTMVIPFLSLYLREDLGFSYKQVGWIMASFGLGSVLGSWIGGKLTDKIGFYKVMTYSLFISGLLFIGIQFLNTFITLCLGIFILMMIADSFRPAMFVALSTYSKPENKTRSVTLIRLAINLGFSAGPAIGGLIISQIGYNGLFWVDGLTCILATLLFIQVLNPKKARIQDGIKVLHPDSAYKDFSFLWFLVGLVLFGIVFLQYFSTMPIYYKDIHGLTEYEIGLLLGFNGLFIFIFEMPLIKWLEHKTFTKLNLIAFGALLTLLSFVVINLTGWSGILIVGMFLMTVGEMIAFPFANAFALERAKKGNQGEYMALFSIAFSAGHIFGHKTGMDLVSLFNFETTWYIMAFLGFVCMLVFMFLRRRAK